MNALDHYERVAALYACMVDAAQANDWDLLVELEHKAAAERKALPRLEDMPPGSLGAQERARIGELIRAALDDDARVRAVVEPWLASARGLLSGRSRERDLRGSYGAFSQSP